MSQNALQITARKEGADETGDIVFLCHNSADKAFIRKLADALELEFGTKFFLDVFAIPTGEAFIPWIEKALENCTACAIFLGGNGWGPTHLWESTFWRRAAIGASAAVVLLLAASAVAITSYVLAEQRRLGSVSRQLAMAARDAAGADRGLLIAARAVLVDATPEARGALLEQLQEFSFSGG